MYYIPVEGEKLIYNCAMCPTRQYGSKIKCNHIFHECPLVQFPTREEAREVLLNAISEDKTTGQMLTDLGFKTVTLEIVT